jgi:hypothetical protein
MQEEKDSELVYPSSSTKKVYIFKFFVVPFNIAINFIAFIEKWCQIWWSKRVHNRRSSTSRIRYEVHTLYTRCEIKLA